MLRQGGRQAIDLTDQSAVVVCDVFDVVKRYVVQAAEEAVREEERLS